MFTLLALYGIIIVAIIIEKGGIFMAETKENTLVLSITEKDEMLLRATCNCLNEARSNECVVHLAHDYFRLFLKMEKRGELLFTISFGLSDFSEQLAEKISIFNAFDRKKYRYIFSSGKKCIKICVQPITKLDLTQKAEVTVNENSEDCSSHFMFPIPLDDVPNVTGDLLNLFGMVKIAQCLTVTHNELQLSAVGDRTNLNIKLFVRPDVNSNDLTTFNMLNSSITGLVRNYKIVQLDDTLPKALIVYIGATKGIEESFNKKLELMHFLTKE